MTTPTLPAQDLTDAPLGTVVTLNGYTMSTKTNMDRSWKVTKHAGTLRSIWKRSNGVVVWVKSSSLGGLVAVAHTGLAIHCTATLA